MKLLFNLLQLIPAFRKLLDEFFESERAELKKQIDFYSNLEMAQSKRAREFEDKAAQAQQRVTQLRQHTSSLENAIGIKNDKIKELRNATTEKLQSVDSLPADDVWAADVFQPKSRP